MPWGAAAAIGGALLTSQATSSAADSQAQSAAESNAISQAQYNQTRADQMPWMSRGNAAGERLSYLLGTTPTVSAANMPDRNAIFNQYEQELSTNGVDVPYAQLNASDKAGRDATVNARYDAAVQAAQQAALPVANTDPNYGSLLKKFSSADLANDPIYNESLRVGLDQGTQGINRQATSNGSLNSGATLKALARFSTDLGASLGNDAYNRNAAYNDSTFNKLSGVAGTGQTSASTIGQAGTVNATTQSNNAIGLGNSRAASAIGAGNSLNSGLSSAAQFYQNQQLMNSFKPQPTIYGNTDNSMNMSTSGFTAY